MKNIKKDKQFYKFCAYGFLKNLRFFDAFFLLFLIDKGISYSQIGILYAIREITINILEIPSGIFADSYGRKLSLLGSFLAYIISFLIFFISNSFLLFLLAFILYGIGDAFRSGTHKGMIMDYLKMSGDEDIKIKYYGHTRACSQKGSALSSLIAGLIIFFGGNYNNIFLYSTIPYFLNFILILSYPKELNRSIIAKKSKFKITIHEFWKILRKPIVLKRINDMAIHSSFLKSIKDYIQPIMVSVSLSIPFLLDIEDKRKTGLIIGILYFILYLMTSRASQLSSKFESFKKGKSVSITLFLGFSLGIFTGISFLREYWTLSLLAFAGIYIIENIRKPILTGYISDSVPNELLTSIMSVQSLLKTILTSIIAVSIGFFADKFGIGKSLVIISAGLIFFTLIFDRFTIKK